MKIGQNYKLFSSRWGWLLAGMLLVGLIGLSGCGGNKQAKTPVDENLIKAQETVRSYWTAITGKDYQKAAQYTEAALFPDRQAELIAKFKNGYEPLALTEIISVDKAYYNPENKRQILVPYRIKGKQELSDKAILRVEDSKQGWLITGGM
jgi:hypothetical protein